MKTGKRSILWTMPAMLCIALSFSLLFASAAFAGDSQGGQSAGGARDGARGGGMQAENDEEVQAVLDAVSDRFIQDVYVDEETGTELEYSLYIPQDYSDDEQYPLLMFIPDSTASGMSAEAIVGSYYGAAVWATDEDQEKHPSFIFVPAFSETVVDDNWNTSGQIDTAVKAIEYLKEQYSIDEGRIYTTGQSMGCMTSLYLNSIYPDMFAASMFVSGQWDISVLKGMEDQAFFYITSAGDSKASAGQAEVMAMFDADGVPYSFGQWNCKDEDQDEKASELIAQDLAANMILFDAQYTDASGAEQTLTHMASFNYAYKIGAVRDWLFEQEK